MRLLLLLLFPAALNAQIYADFTVSSGGSPLGTFTVLLEHQKAPRTCANFIGLASGKRPWVDLANGAVRVNKPFYDGLTFHRLDHEFLIQGGSPNGHGKGEPGYSILDEYHPDLRHSAPYVISMAKKSYPNTGGSQFFITQLAAPPFDNKHSVFGRVISGTEIIDGFKNPGQFPTDAGQKPLMPIVMDSVVISGPDYDAFDINDPALRLPHVSGTQMRITRDTAAGSMTAFYDRKPKTEYMFLESADLATWTNPHFVLSLDEAEDEPFVVSPVTEPSYFLNLTTVSHENLPNAPADLIDGGKTLRLKFPAGGYIDLNFDGENGGNWHDPGSDRTAPLAGTTWTDQAGETGTLGNDFSLPFAIPLGHLDTTLVDYFGPGDNLRLVTWVSFHTDTRGWIEETSGGPVNRFAFEILSN